ncbi:transcription antitermination factor NusB [Streptococcus himalayensis]|uniref:Transcription antitermination protein NusB n=1 Tax=Streptococcus himalayensis TaxID=1888195 RepID=A0A917AAU8_9STRE|nr:transcription antitermination factor NusB [Streptococcus himalayensis]GGE37965.1 N utilization substance protein B [Streptococcus himalayensis]
MTDVQLETRRDLRERAFQALMAMEYGKDVVEACQFAYLHDRDEEKEMDIPAFLLNLVSGVAQSKDELDESISQHLKEGWTLERLTSVDRNLLRLGVFEITAFNTPQLVAINEAIELAKTYSDEKSSRFINGLLSQFVVDKAEVAE